jgi:hypothetical protein
VLQVLKVSGQQSLETGQDYSGCWQQSAASSDKNEQAMAEISGFIDLSC